MTAKAEEAKRLELRKTIIRGRLSSLRKDAHDLIAETIEAVMAIDTEEFMNHIGDILL